MEEDSEKNRLPTAEEKEKAERESKIDEIKKAALLNMQRKISQEQNYAGKGWHKLVKYTEACAAARNLRKASSTTTKYLETAAANEVNVKRQRSKSVVINPTPPVSKINSRKISQPARPARLPAIVTDGRKRSSTFTGVGETEARINIGKNDLNNNHVFYDKDDKLLEIIAENNKISSLIHHKAKSECGFDDLGSQNFLTIAEVNSENDEVGLREKNEELVKSNIIQEENISKSPMSHLVDIPMGRKSVPPNTITVNKKIEEADVGMTSSDDEENLPGISDVTKKLKDFMQRPQPNPPPQSLKISKELFLERNREHRRLHLPEINPTTKQNVTGGMIFNFNLYMNPFVKHDGESWHYTDKYGKCRYLRGPATPVLTVEEIFQKNEGNENEAELCQEKLRK